MKNNDLYVLTDKGKRLAKLLRMKIPLSIAVFIVRISTTKK